MIPFLLFISSCTPLIGGYTTGYSNGCCDKKTVGGVDYIYSEEDNEVVSWLKCLNGCVYKKLGEPGGSRFCFRLGYKEVKCNDIPPLPYSTSTSWSPPGKTMANTSLTGSTRMSTTMSTSNQIITKQSPSQATYAPPTATPANDNSATATPATTTPATAAHANTTSATAVPLTATSATADPATTTPATDTAAPAAPETAAQETVAPETASPETAAPETTASETAVPVTVTLATAAPATTKKPEPRPCKPGTAGDGNCCLEDKDGDGWAESTTGANCKLRTPPDNCPDVPNGGQEDSDKDGKGDACDKDKDGDDILDEVDNCPLIPNPDQKDTDGDDVGDVCDNCKNVKNKKQEDKNNNKVGDACDNEDGDEDKDGKTDGQDNCPKVNNPGQEDADGDGVGDVCDNCKNVTNTNQEDVNNNMVGDACDNDLDTDKDGVPDVQDNCVTTPNADQVDTDNDGEGDVCDNDADNDKITNDKDNCFMVANTNQTDSDGDGVGDACQDNCDGDAVNDDKDICRCDRTKSVTDFRGLINHTIGASPDEFLKTPIWEFTDGGKQIKQFTNSLATLAIGTAVFSNVRFTGTLFVDTNRDDDVAGIVFNYQDNKNFYTVSSSKQDSGQGTWSLKRVNSNTGHPSDELQKALFDHLKTVNASVPGQTKYFELSPDKGWKAKTAYSWLVEVDDQPTVLNIRIEIWEGAINVVNKTIADTDEDRLVGGRLGVYCQSQKDVTWARMSTQCL